MNTNRPTILQPGLRVQWQQMFELKGKARIGTTTGTVVSVANGTAVIDDIFGMRREMEINRVKAC